MAIDDRQAANLGSGIIRRALERDRDVLKLIAELEREMRVSLKRILADLRSTDKETRIDAAQAAQSLGSLYEELKAAGLGDKLEEITDIYGDELAAVRSELKRVQPDLILTDTDITAAATLIEYDFSRYGKVIEKNVGDVRSTIMRSVISGSAPDIDGAIDAAAPRVAAQLETELNTALSAFNQAITNQKADEVGLNVFVYLGPDDKVTRPFCKDVIDKGRVFSRAQIEAMDNEQGLPVMEAGGGWNCRHQWRPISKEEARQYGFDDKG
jgi:hypothetical protein